MTSSGATTGGPRITVITAVFNGMPYLPHAVESILRQSNQNFHYIIVNDGSTDGTRSYLDTVQDHRITVLDQRNLGKSAAINNALPHISTDYWIMQDADDIAYPERLEAIVDALDADPTLGAVFSGWTFLTGSSEWAPTLSPRSKAYCREQVERLRLPGHDATLAFRTTATHGRTFDETLRLNEGADFFFQVAEAWEAMVVGACLLTYRVHERSITKTRRDEITASDYTVRARAAARRGKDAVSWQLPARRKPQRFMANMAHELVPHSMDSVAEMRELNLRSEAYRVAIRCISMNPLGPIQYKPLIYAIIPLRWLRRYRRRRSRTDTISPSR